MKFHCSSHRKFEQIVVTSTEQPPDQLCDGKTCGSGSHIIAFEFISLRQIGQNQSLCSVPHNHYSLRALQHNRHKTDGWKKDKQTNSKYGKHWFTKFSSPKKRESPLQDVNLEKFWTFVRVAYVCIHVCVHVFTQRFL